MSWGKIKHSPDLTNAPDSPDSPEGRLGKCVNYVASHLCLHCSTKCTRSMFAGVLDEENGAECLVFLLPREPDF